MAEEPYTMRILHLMTSQPGEWFDGMALAKVGGAYAWRSRVSEARQWLRGRGIGDIENLQVRAKGQPTRSLYRYVQAKPDGQRGLFS